LLNVKEKKIFQEAVIGYGFVQIDQNPDGIYCTGCMTVHKRPTKMYTNEKDTLCSYQVVRLYNPSDCE